jgi:hypothetical protein
MAIVIVSRADWGARSPKSRSEISLPTARLWIHHTAGSERGAAGMRSIQNTHAICVMGNFMNIQPSTTAIDSIVALAEHGREQGWWTPTCRGHRQAPGAATECPGDNLFAKLDEIRTRVGVGPGPAPRQAEEDLDVTEAELRQIVREEIKNVLDGQARRVQGITSWERYLEVLLEAARKS